MNWTVIRVDRAGSTWHVTLNRPGQGNACSGEMVQELHAAFIEAAQEGATALVLQGEGRHFCTGFDLSGLEGESDDTLLARFVRVELLLQSVARAPFMTVAVAQGRTIGAGADLFAACSVRAIRGNASFSFPGAKGFGLVLGTRRLVNLVGEAIALDWIETARHVPREEALQRGLASAVVEDDCQLADLVARSAAAGTQHRSALKEVITPHAASRDALDLALLVQSAARQGLRDRLASFLERTKAHSSPIALAKDL